MKTLEEHNRDALATMHLKITERTNGIMCPKCFTELHDDLRRILTGNPPQVRVFCKACGFSGSRY